MLGMVTIVTLSDFAVRMKIIGRSSKLQHFDLATLLLNFRKIPTHGEILEYTEKTGFGEGEPITVISEADSKEYHDPSWKSCGINPLLQPAERGYTHVIYI